MLINFNVPSYTGKELEYIRTALENSRESVNTDYFISKCTSWVEEHSQRRALLTTSCTHALEMTALILNIQPGDEIIAPSYTYVSTVNPFVLRGAKIVFVDINPHTMNIDENQIEAAITKNTKAVVPVHYAGVASEMDEILQIAQAYKLSVVEDAAHGVMAAYKGRMVGSIGDFGAYSFHRTKNFSMGEGGALLIRQAAWREKAEIIREKGTDRSRFLRGEVNRYSWVDIGSSYEPSEIQAAYLYAQLEAADAILKNRLMTWSVYYEELHDLAEKGYIELPVIPEHCTHNGHIFFIKCKDLQERTALISYLHDHGISAAFHFIPLHSSAAGQKFGRFHGDDRYTTRESERLVRLPLYYGLEPDKTRYIIEIIAGFYHLRRGLT